MIPSKIRTPSFAFEDITRSVGLTGIAGIVICLAGGIGAALSVSGYEKLVDIDSAFVAAGRATATLASNADAVKAGQDSILPAGLAAIGEVARPMADVERQDPLLLLGSTKVAVSQAHAGWRTMVAAAAPLQKSRQANEALQSKLAETIPDLVRAGKRIDALGMAALSDAIGRLQSYADIGLVTHNAPRIEYGLKTFVSLAGAADTSGRPEMRLIKQDADKLAFSLLPLATAASAATPSGQEIVTFVDSARAANAQIASAGRALGPLRATVATGAFVSIAAILLGLVMLCAAVGMLIRDFEGRFKRSMTQFLGSQRASKQLLKEIGQIGEGDFGIMARTDETATRDLAEMVNKITGRIRQLMVQVKSAATAVEGNARIAELTIESNVGSSRAEQLQIENLVQALENAEAAIAAIVDDTKASAFAVKATMGAVYDGARAVQDSVEKMDGIRDHIQETSKRIKRLAERSQEAGKIVTILSGLSEQAKVLSLNALLEANRAGEDGRSFQVVANEVERLSTKTVEATSNIALIVVSMQADAREAIDAMERSTQSVIDGAHVVEVAGASIAVVKGVMDSLANMVSTIASTTTSQQRLTLEVGKGAARLLAASKQSAARISSGASTTSDISRQAREIVGLANTVSA